MSQSLISGESVDQGIRRVIRQQLELSAGQLSGESLDLDTAVHGVRKRIKRVRSLLRLIQPNLRRRHFSTLNKRLRDTARRLAGARA